MSDIEDLLRKLKDRGEGALIAYICGGDPAPEYTPEIVDALIRGGADIIELGIPFSDPIADGPTIQAASVRALNAGTTPFEVMQVAGRIREEHRSIPLVVLTYYNPIYRMGVERFFKQAREYEINGVIVPDLPIEEATEYKRTAEAHGIDTMFLATPNTTSERLERIIEYTSGFLYLVSIFGVTGARDSVHKLTIQTLKKLLPYIRGRIPLAVGFGISEPEHVRTVIGSGADGAIVGSALVKIVEKHIGEHTGMLRALKEKTYELKTATRVNIRNT
jgi:tryptophan synthase alpha chain